MYNVIKMTLLVGMTTMFMACGGGGGGGSSSGGATSTGITAMTIGETVSIGGGDSIVNSSADATIDIVVIGNQKTATLTAGSASIKTP
ncbi:hypothetical protein MNB_SM-4-728 [hydrothermal vent metagenome]|uniref:Uncharacterized protein n=1 Tax=hydrothermal vent metagenome TaxID=652676 RepID=A0A1W1CP88_9ZZZZ